MEDISLAQLIITAFILIIAGLVHGTLGVGFPVLATPLIALMVDVRIAILLTLLPTTAVNIGSIIHGGNWRDSIGRFWPLALYSVIGAAIGSQALIMMDPTPFKLALAALVLLYLGVSQSKGFGMAWVQRYSMFSMALFGVVAGISAGTTNVMLPILVIYTLELGLARTTMIQTFNMCFLLGKLTQMALFANAGLFTGAVVLTTLPLAAISAVALLFGMRFRKRIAAQTYVRIIRVLLSAVAVVLIGQFLNDKLA